MRINKYLKRRSNGVPDQRFERGFNSFRSPGVGVEGGGRKREEEAEEEKEEE